MNPPYPLRRVTRTQDVTNHYCRPGDGSRWHFLECGHNVVTKQSCGFPARKRCRDCGLNRPADDPPTTP